MKKTYFKLTVGIAITFIILSVFLICQNNLAQSFNKKQVSISDSLNNITLLKLNDVEMRCFEEKINGVEKYIELSQKNLDFWLILLVFILSVFIGLSVFNGLRIRELAKEELIEVKKIANDAEERLKNVTDQINQIEYIASNAKKIEDDMKKQLNEIGGKREIVLNATQLKLIDNSISKTKEDLQKSGIEILKNLYYAKALKISDENKWEEALRLWNSYIDIEENNETAYIQRGYTKIYIKDYNGAIDDCTKAIEINSKSEGAYDCRAFAKLRNNDSLGALSDYNKAININPKDELAFWSRGGIKESLKDYNGAIEDFTKAIEINPNVAGIYYGRGFTKGNYNLDYNDAIVDYSKAIEIDPKYAEAYLARGLAKIKLENKEDGCLDIKKASELGYTEADGFLKLYCQKDNSL